MNPLALLSLLVALGFPVAYSAKAGGGLGALVGRGHSATAAHHGGAGGGMSSSEAAALEAARQEGEAGGGGGGGGLEGLLAALLQGRMGGIGLTSADYGQNLGALESGVQNAYDGTGYYNIPGAYAPEPTSAELAASSPGGTQAPATSAADAAAAYYGGSGAAASVSYPGGGGGYITPPTLQAPVQQGQGAGVLAAYGNTSYSGVYSAPSAKAI